MTWAANPANPPAPSHGTIEDGGRTWSLPRSDRASCVARRLLRDQLMLWHATALTDDALLVTCELVTNAVTHGQGEVALSLSCRRLASGARQLRIEVSDQGSGISRRQRAVTDRAGCCPALGTGGRGLYLVRELADSWGDTPAAGGHTTWAVLSRSAPGS